MGHQFFVAQVTKVLGAFKCVASRNRHFDEWDLC